MSRTETIRLGTRGSQLALTQSRQVAAALEAACPGLLVELEIIRTTGDRVLDVPLSRIGDKGLFTKELETALIDGTVDFAVHSMKDMPTKLPEGLVIGCVPTRKPPYDCLLSPRPGGFAALAQGARVATGSLRRRAQLRHARPDLRIEEMRGNVPTRIRKMAEQELDGIVLALAGLSRLGVPALETAEAVAFEVPESWDDAIAGATLFIARMPADVCLPAVGQGALCLEVRADNRAVLDVLSVLDDAASRDAVTCERALMRSLEGGCQVPIAAWAQVQGDALRLQAMVASLDGQRRLVAEGEGPRDGAEALGVEVARRLRDQGAGEILDEIRRQAAAPSPSPADAARADEPAGD